MNKRLFTPLVSFLLTIIVSLSSFAAPADPNPIKLKQPDGSEITILLKGDEKVHWMETLDGYSLMYNNNKTVVYATTNTKGDMIPSDVIVSEKTLRSSTTSDLLEKTPKGLRYSPSQVQALLKIWEITEKTTVSKATSMKTAKAICALISYSDKPITKTAEEFSQLMNQVGYTANGAKGSVRDFYKENSYGQLDLVVTVAGPYTVSKDWAYYGKNLANGNDSFANELAREAANLAFKDPNINPADFDNDKDGYIDTFHFLYAGYGEEAGGGSDCIWAHKSGFNTPLSFGNLKLDTYSCSPELRGSSGSIITTIGVVCHELCHVFGAPDYYDTDGVLSGGDYAGTGLWDLMSSGSWNESGNSPAHINMYQKIVFGWVTPTSLSAETTITNMKNSAENPIAYTYQTTTPGEYYVLENRQKVGFDNSNALPGRAALPGHGLLIYHVSKRAVGNKVNNNGHPQDVYPVCASSSFRVPTAIPASYGSINSSGCTFPGTANKTAFTDYTIPSAVDWSGKNTSKPITDITESNGLISFKFKQSTPSVTNVKATVSGQTVTISWSKPVGDVTGYVIYRSGVALITLSDPSVVNYTQYRVNPGTYDYCVTALYGNVESSIKICTTATVASGIVSTCSPIKNLSKIEKADTIKLSWEPAFDGGWFAQSGPRSNNIVGYGATNYSALSYWPTEDLKDMYGYTLTKLKVFIQTLTGCEYTVQVWNPLSSDTKIGTPIISQKLNPTKTGDQEIILSTPYKLDNSNRELLIGINYKQTIPGEIVATDNGPKKENRNFLYVNDTLYSYQGDFNFYLEGYLEDKGNQATLQSIALRSDSPARESVRQSPLTLTHSYIEENAANTLKASMAGASGYKVYRDGVLIQTTTTPSFTDTGAPAGTHIYCVSSIYGTCESEQMCIEATSRKPVPPTSLPVLKDENQINIFPNPIDKGGNLTIDLGEGSEKADLLFYNTSGQLVKQEQVSNRISHRNINLNSGVYLLQVKKGQQINILKIIVR